MKTLERVDSQLRAKAVCLPLVLLRFALVIAVGTTLYRTVSRHLLLGKEPGKGRTKERAIRAQTASAETN